MGRTLFGPGAQGAAVEAIQQALSMERVDGVYGHQTIAGVTQFQHSQGLPMTGVADDITWAQLVKQPVPALFERCLALTSHFEGHGFSLAVGNFDGAGLTWGIIGFTLRSGSLGDVIRHIAQNAPGVLERSLGPLAKNLLGAVAMDETRRVEWGASISPNGALSLPWRTALYRLGLEPAAREAQLAFARTMYFQPAEGVARELGFTDELGLALCFDIQVQMGGPILAARQSVRASGTTGRARRELLAERVSATASERWRQDVFARKMAVASGMGRVHGEYYEMANWGLGEYPA